MATEKMSFPINRLSQFSKPKAVRYWLNINEPIENDWPMENNDNIEADLLSCISKTGTPQRGPESCRCVSKKEYAEYAVCLESGKQL